MRQQTRKKSLDNDLLTLKENYDKEISSTRDRLAAIGEMEKSAGTELQAVLAGERESLNQNCCCSMRSTSASARTLNSSTASSRTSRP